jgi:hypothetical protein
MLGVSRPAPTRRRVLAGAASTLLLPLAARAGISRYDVVVYGGTASGVMAAVAAARAGVSVALVLGLSPIGGMPANGLSLTDAVSLEFIAGIAREFFIRCGAHYGLPSALKFEPHVAEAVFREMLAETDAAVFDGTVTSVRKDDTKLVAIRLSTGASLIGKNFVDASYEGDVMAAAGVTYSTGRESQRAYGEPLAGYGISRYSLPIPPYEDGKRLFGLRSPPTLAIGAGDNAVMAYCYRLCLTDDPSDLVAFPKPTGYNPDDFLYWLHDTDFTRPFDPGGQIGATRKFDRNDDVDAGLNWHYPDASPQIRATMWAQQKLHSAGRLYFLGNDPRVPASYRDSVQQYGLAADEFTDNGNWPRQLYVREARRLHGRLRLQQQDIEAGAKFQDAAFTWHYGFDSHMTQIFPADAEHVEVEGGPLSTFPSSNARPYQVPLRCFLPHPFECSTLAVSVCASLTRVAFCAYRLEPAYMQAGAACGALAAESILRRTPMWTLS